MRTAAHGSKTWREVMDILAWALPSLAGYDDIPIPGIHPLALPEGRVIDADGQPPENIGSGHSAPARGGPGARAWGNLAGWRRDLLRRRRGPRRDFLARSHDPSLPGRSVSGRWRVASREPQELT